MTDGRRWAALLAVPLVALLGACGEDDAGPLAEDQLPGEVAETSSGDAGVPIATSCSDLMEAQQRVSVSGASEGEATGEDNYRYWIYRLDDGSSVTVSVGQVGSPYADAGEALDEIAAALDTCVADGDGSVAALDDVPEGSVGYASTTTDSNGTREGETLLAVVDDRVVTVAATHDEGAEPSVDVRDLLADVEDRAGDLDLSSARA